MWTDQPDGPGIYLFKGSRQTPSRRYVIQIKSAVLLTTDVDHLAVSHFDTKGSFHIKDYVGKWKYIGDLLDE